MNIDKNNIVSDSAEYIDHLGSVHNINDDIEQAEADIVKMKNDCNVNFRWSEFEVARAKKIAAQLGMPYQTYLKSTLKQAMDEFEKKSM